MERGVFMGEIWVKYVILVSIALIYLVSVVIKDRQYVNKYYKNYKEVKAICKGVKYITKDIVNNVEGSYEVHLYSYLFNYFVDDVEYNVSREEEILDMYLSDKVIDTDDTLSIWVNPNDFSESFIPLFDDNTKKSMSALFIMTILFVILGVIIVF